MGYDSLINHFNRHEFEYYGRTFIIGLGNFLPSTVQRSFMWMTAHELGCVQHCLYFQAFLELLGLVAGAANVKFLLQVNSLTRAVAYNSIEALTWVMLAISCLLIEKNPELSYKLTGAACVLSRVTLTLGRAMKTCSFRVLPAELTPFLGLGTCVAALIGTVLISALSHDLSHIWLFFPLSMATLGKLLCQVRFAGILKFHYMARELLSASIDYNIYSLYTKSSESSQTSIEV